MKMKLFDVNENKLDRTELNEFFDDKLKNLNIGEQLEFVIKRLG